MDPEFHHTEAKDIPSWSENGVQYKLIAGEVLGHKSPVPVYSMLYMIEVKTDQESKVINFNNQLFGESGLYILEGEIVNDNHIYGSKQILITKDPHLCSFEMRPNTTVYIFGGEPFDEERFIFWNFVATSRAIIEEAKLKWKNHEFPLVPGDDDYVPMP